MTRHDDALLWDYAAHNLEAGEAKLVDHHLDECPDCREKLDAVLAARTTLKLARSADPIMQWESVDARIGAVVERRLQAKARQGWRLWALGGALVATAAAAAWFVVQPNTDAQANAFAALTPATQDAAPLEDETTRIEQAQGLLIGSAKAPALKGATLQKGDVLRTDRAGKAFVHLADSSHVRVASGTQVALTKSGADDVALTLERGRLAIRASHHNRKDFVVNSAGVSVHVVGTIFSVERGPAGVEVAVAEGRVRVEASGSEQFVEPGERVRFDGKTGRVQRARLTPALSEELAEVKTVADLDTTVQRPTEPKVMVAASGGAVGPGARHPGSLPRLDARDAQARQGTLPEGVMAPVVEAPAAPPPAPPAEKTITLQGRGDVWPSISGEVHYGVPPKPEGEAVAVPVEAPAASAVEAPPTVAASPPVMVVPSGRAGTLASPASTTGSTEAEWATLPSAPEPAPVAVAKSPAPARAMPRDLEAIFLQRAEASIERGGCNTFLLGLEEIAGDAQHTERTEQARVLRARCFATQLRPRQALVEYRKYIEEYPVGRFAAEAREALGE